MIPTLWRQWTCSHSFRYTMRITNTDYIGELSEADHKPELLVYECPKCLKIKYEKATEGDDFKDLGSDHGKKK